MAEELRFFLRTALYAAVTAAIYWFLSYEWVGTMLLAFVVAGAGFFTFFFGATVRAARSEIESKSLIHVTRRVFGFDERPRDDESGPLATEEEPLPPASIWPLVASLGALLIGGGLVFGGWLWMPGAAISLIAAWGWLNELEP